MKNFVGRPFLGLIFLTTLMFASPASAESVMTDAQATPFYNALVSKNTQVDYPPEFVKFMVDMAATSTPEAAARIYSLFGAVGINACGTEQDDYAAFLSNVSVNTQYVDADGNVVVAKTQLCS